MTPGQNPPPEEKPAFDTAARRMSTASLSGSALTMILALFPPDRGVDFGLHMLLALMFTGQLVLLVLFTGTGVILAGFCGGLRLSRSTAVLSLVASAALAGQYGALYHLPVDGSSVP